MSDVQRKPLRFHLRKSVNGQFYVNMVAKNGSVLMTSETYARTSGARSFLRTMAKNVGMSLVEIKRDSAGQPVKAVSSSGSDNVVSFFEIR